jgi:hypothetical protein
MMTRPQSRTESFIAAKLEMAETIRCVGSSESVRDLPSPHSDRVTMTSVLET